MVGKYLCLSSKSKCLLSTEYRLYVYDTTTKKHDHVKVEQPINKIEQLSSDVVVCGEDKGFIQAVDIKSMHVASTS